VHFTHLGISSWSMPKWCASSCSTVARTCARLFDLPVVIARMNASYGANGGLPTYYLDTMPAGLPVAICHDQLVGYSLNRLRYASPHSLFCGVSGNVSR